MHAREANTTYGKIGIKVWVYNGEILPEDRKRKLEERIARVVEAEPDTDERERRIGIAIVPNRRLHAVIRIARREYLLC